MNPLQKKKDWRWGDGVLLAGGYRPPIGKGWDFVEGGWSGWNKVHLG